MRIGHGRVELPVPDGTPLGGYADRPGPSSGCLDPLQVNAILFAADDGPRFALVACDVVCVNTDLADSVRVALAEEGVDVTWLAAGHTHSGPETGCIPGGATTPPPWLDTIREAAIEAVRQARLDLQPRPGMCHPCTIAGVGGVRSEPVNLIDLPVDVVTIGADGLIVVLPLHPTVLNSSNVAVSADLVGAVRAYLEAVTQRWTVVLTGAAGDISTRHGRRGQDFAEVQRLAAIIGVPIADAASRAGHTLWSAGDPITSTHRSVDLVPMPDAVRNELRRRATAALAAPSGARTASTLRHAAEHVAAYGTSRSARVGVVRLGRWTLGGVPGEPFLASGREFSQRLSASGLATLLGYTNGYVGYLPTRDRFSTPTYETLITPYTPGTAEDLVDVLVRLAG